MSRNKFKICICALLCALFVDCSAQRITITDVESSVGKRMEANATALLKALNKSFSKGEIPQLNKIKGMSKYAKSAILNMWETTAPFKCTKNKIIERGLKKPSGYQVRNIPLFLKDTPEDEAYKEITINFDTNGAIEDIYFTLDLHNYKAIMESEGNEFTDLQRRSQILDFVENFRIAYSCKDIDLLAKIWSDDALIITGKGVKQSRPVEKNEYEVQTKKECINKLRSILKNNARINVKFDKIEVVQHPKYPDIYGVRLLQEWNTDNYSDVGYLFLIIDFKDGENVEVLNRMWQPEKVNGQPLSEDEVYKLGDFLINAVK